MATTTRPKTTKANASNAFATRWVQDGTTFELCAVKGGYNLVLGVLPAESTRWTTTTVSDPERFTQE